MVPGRPRCGGLVTLTGMLDQKDSPLRRWFDRTFPNTRAVLGAGRWPGQLAAPARCAPNSGGLVGMAVDQRLRWHWPAEPAVSLLTGTIAVRALGPDAAGEFIDHVGEVCAKYAPTRRTGRVQVEDLLARTALVLAHLETVYRTGRAHDPAWSGVGPGRSPEEMPAAQDPANVADVIAVAKAAASLVRPLARQPAALNPTFPLSRLVGAADADIIAGDLLVEFKTTT